MQLQPCAGLRPADAIYSIEKIQLQLTLPKPAVLERFEKSVGRVVEHFPWLRNHADCAHDTLMGIK